MFNRKSRTLSYLKFSHFQGTAQSNFKLGKGTGSFGGVYYSRVRLVGSQLSVPAGTHLQLLDIENSTTAIATVAAA